MKQRVQLVLKHSEVFMSTVSQANRCLMVLTGLHSPRGLSKVALNSPTEQDQDCKVGAPPCSRRQTDRKNKARTVEKLTISVMKQVSQQIVDQLVEAVMKLCLIMAKHSNNGAALTDLEEQASSSNNSNFSQARGPRYSHEAGMCQSYQDCHGPEVIVNNQGSTSSFQKQLQAVLQWIAASQLNVPMLSFMGDSDGQLEKDLLSQDGCQREGFWEVGHVVPPFELSRTLPVGGGLFPSSLPGPPVM
ncbi:A-kinase anchor protein 4-like isoform X2 [Moschus berezovskii]|uniref:A-kinase anchor protein 4-like isoform X2 n=1 Tax=Moschus berezovskii TaxID=68408 RepID=UPI002444D57C|nr:A-kinase anchor protein 4-like isoform X2 [Moschus berezovskii]